MVYNYILINKIFVIVISRSLKNFFSLNFRIYDHGLYKHNKFCLVYFPKENEQKVHIDVNHIPSDNKVA